MFAAVSDLFPSSAVARVTGLTGIAGGLSGMLFPLLTGVLVDRIWYTPVFAMASLMPAAGLLILVTFAGRFEQVIVRGVAMSRTPTDGQAPVGIVCRSSRPPSSWRRRRAAQVQP